jgi:hypothetical protein
MCSDLIRCLAPDDPCLVAVCIEGFCETDPKDCSGVATSDGCEVGVCEPATGECKAQDLEDGTPCSGGYCHDGVCSECSGNLGCAGLGETCCGGTCVGGSKNDLECCFGVPCAAGLCAEEARLCCDLPCGDGFCCPDPVT